MFLIYFTATTLVPLWGILTWRLHNFGWNISPSKPHKLIPRWIRNCSYSNHFSIISHARYLNFSLEVLQVLYINSWWLLQTKLRIRSLERNSEIFETFSIQCICLSLLKKKIISTCICGPVILNFCLKTLNITNNICSINSFTLDRASTCGFPIFDRALKRKKKRKENQGNSNKKKQSKAK